MQYVQSDKERGRVMKIEIEIRKPFDSAMSVTLVGFDEDGTAHMANTCISLDTRNKLKLTMTDKGELVEVE